MMQRRSYKIPLIISCLGISSLLLFSYLTFIPNSTFAVTMPDPGELRTLSQIDTMQQMSQQICINSREHETKRLEDNRDGNKYWVAKLKDGNCWMTQNLDYIPSSPTTKAAPSNWTTGASANLYYDPDESGNGEYYYYTNGTGTSDEGEATSVCTKIVDSLKNCVAFTKKIPDFSTEAGLKQEHYRVGNYYSWQAAQNVCPTNGVVRWYLPVGNSIAENGSFGKMLASYGIADNSAITATIYADPLYFVYSGLVYSAGLENSGRYGYYWSSTPIDSNRAYYLVFGGGMVRQSSTVDNPRYYGTSVRCLAMGGWLDSYPDPNDQANVAIVVAPVISIDVTKHADKMETDFTHVATDTITARVGSNLPYQVLISTEKSELTLSNEKKEDTLEKTSGEEVAAVADTPAPSIPMLQKEGKITAGIGSWGIGKDNDIKVTRISSIDGSSVEVNNPTITSDTIYYPVGIDPEKIPFYTSTSAATEILEFPVAIAISSTIPFGTYSTQVTLTAVAN